MCYLNNNLNKQNASHFTFFLSGKKDKEYCINRLQKFFHSLNQPVARVVFFCLYFFISPNLIYSQGKNWSVQFSALPGKLIRHTEKMKFNPSGYSKFLELDIVYQTNQLNSWEQFYNFPRIGFSLRYLNLGEPNAILGHAYSFAPFLDLGFLQEKNYSFRFLIACGLAYLNRPYQINRNPLQTAIGSNLNNMTSFQLRFEHKILKNQLLFAGIALSHLSNGAYQSPNLGLNYLSGILGLGFVSNRPEIDNSEKSNCFKIPKRSKFSYVLETGMTLKESRIPGGPKFLINWYALDFGYQYHDYKSWRLSAELENNHLASYFSDYSEVKPNKQSAWTDGLRFNTYLAHQWLFGNLSMSCRMGYQFLRNISLGDYPVVTKLDLSYIVPVSIIKNLNPYFGLSLKTHFGTAEYIGVMTGLRLHLDKKIILTEEN